jgi:hypothetical protein
MGRRIEGGMVGDIELTTVGSSTRHGSASSPEEGLFRRQQPEKDGDAGIRLP